MRIPRANWLASYPKSGNTWVRMFIQAYGTGELDIGMLNIVESDLDVYAWQNVCPFPIPEVGNDVLLLLRNAVIVHIIAKTGKRPIILKTHNVHAEINGIHPFPELITDSAVYLIRDPRDVAISWAKHLGVSVDEAIGFMNDKTYILRKQKSSGFHFTGTWSDNVKSWKHATVVRYEDMLENPKESFTKILDAYGLTVNKPRLGKAIRLCNLERVKKQEKKKRFAETSEHTDSFFHHGTSGHWKDILSPDQVRRIERDHREVMEQYNYLESNVSELNNVA